MTDKSFLNKNEKKGLNFDPRIKLMLLLLISIFVMGGAGGEAMMTIRLILSILPAILLVSARKWRKAVLYSFIYIICELIQIHFLQNSQGIVNVTILILSGTACRFLPTYIMAYYTFSTTGVDELISSLNKMHVTDNIIIPLTVMFRFFPTAMEEYRAISDTMKMRGISIKGKKATKIFEYRIIPLISSSVKIGEELSAAALTRGLGAPFKRTEVCEVRFCLQDYLIIFLCLGAIIWPLIS